MLLDAQRRLARDGAVAVGRDCGTVVFPEAQLKLYLDASEPVRAQRRASQLRRRARTRTARSCAARWALVIGSTPRAALRRCSPPPTRTCSTPACSGIDEVAQTALELWAAWPARGDRQPAGVTSGFSQPDHLVAFDLETTGLSPRSDRILEIGAVRYDSALRPIDELQVIVDPQIPIPLAIQRLVGLTDEDVLGAPPPAEAAARLAGFCGDAALIAHGGTFDLLFLRALLSETFGSRLIYDTLDLARILLPTYESHSLPLLSRRLGISHERPHRALSDARATGDLFRVLVGAGRVLPEATLVEMRRVASQAPGPLDAFLSDVMLRPAVEAAAPVDHAAVSTAPAAYRPTGEPARPRRTAAASATPQPRSSAPTARSRRGTGYEYREAQVQMAMAVGQTLERKRRLMVEAGTGVGKSLAYLTPLALWAARTGKRAVVATHTVNLQEQLADRDLPTVAGAARRAGVGGGAQGAQPLSEPSPVAAIPRHL